MKWFLKQQKQRPQIGGSVILNWPSPTFVFKVVWWWPCILFFFFFCFAKNLQAHVKYSKNAGPEFHSVKLCGYPSLEGQYFFHTSQEMKIQPTLPFVGTPIPTGLSLYAASWVPHREHCTVTFCCLRMVERDSRNV